MYWSFNLADCLNDAPWPATKEELIEFCHRAPIPAAFLDNLLSNLHELPDEDNIVYLGMEDLWPDMPKRSEYFHHDEDEDNPSF